MRICLRSCILGTSERAAWSSTSLRLDLVHLHHLPPRTSACSEYPDTHHHSLLLRCLRLCSALQCRWSHRGRLGSDYAWPCYESVLNDGLPWSRPGSNHRRLHGTSKRILAMDLLGYDDLRWYLYGIDYHILARNLRARVAQVEGSATTEGGSGEEQRSIC